VDFATGVSEQERGHISGILETVKAHATSLEIFREDHSGQAASIEENAQDTFREQYMVG
jgi:kinesin family protein 11